MPGISVVLSVYKENELSIKRSVDSILHQTFNDFEFIIVLDDPANKAVINLILNYASADTRVKYIVHEKNKGLAASLNEGIKLATGKYIARQDAEDVSLPERLFTQYNYMQMHDDVSVLGTAIKYMDAKGKVILNRTYKSIVGDEIKKYNPLAHPTLLIRRSTFYDFGFYQEGLFNEDYELWMRWYIQGVKMHNLQQFLYEYIQKDGEKEGKAKPQLKDTIKIKLKHAKALHYKFGDYLYLYIQKFLLLLPSNFIVKLFYLSNTYSENRSYIKKNE